MTVGTRLNRLQIVARLCSQLYWCKSGIPLQCPWCNPDWLLWMGFHSVGFEWSWIAPDKMEIIENICKCLSAFSKCPHCVLSREMLLVVFICRAWELGRLSTSFHVNLWHLVFRDVSHSFDLAGWTYLLCCGTWSISTPYPSDVAVVLWQSANEEMLR